MSGNLPALYEIANQFQELAALADFDDLPAEVIKDTLEALEGTLQLKTTNIIKFVLGLEADAAAMDSAAEAMKQRANRRRKRAESIKAYVLFNLQAASISKVDCPEFTVSVQNNPKGVEVTNVELIPSKFMKQPEPPPPTPDKSAIKAAIEAGEQVPGAWLYQGQHLRIRT
jgi:hypothetical protein